MSKVSYYYHEDYRVEDLKRTVERIILDHGGYERLFQKGKRVVIKPNLVIKKSPDAAATTHPALLEAVILCLKEHTDSITVAECSGGPNTEALMHGIYRETGIEEVCLRHHIPMVTKLEAVPVAVPNSLSCPMVEVLKDFRDAEVFINLAKMKTHSLTTVSGAAKNLYGTVPGLRKVEYHARFSQVREFAGLICDLNAVLPPTLSIVDGIWGMEKDGPTGGVPKFAGAVLGGVNPYAIDEAMCRIMGIPSELSPILARAKEAGLFQGEYTLCGENPEEHLPTPFELPDSQKRNILRDLPTIFGGKFGKFLAAKPKIKKDICVGCGECARLCPQKTITVEKRKAVIHHKNCIRCWCCQELCPKKAIEAHSHWFLKFM